MPKETPKRHQIGYSTNSAIWVLDSAIGYVLTQLSGMYNRILPPHRHYPIRICTPHQYPPPYVHPYPTRYGCTGHNGHVRPRELTEIRYLGYARDMTLRRFAWDPVPYYFIHHNGGHGTYRIHPVLTGENLRSFGWKSC